MLVDPGRVVREYIAGRRRYYANPVSLYLLVAAVAFVFREAFDFADPPSPFAAMQGWGRSSSLQSTLLGLALVLPLTFFARRTFSRHGWNFAETAVFVLFALATCGVLSMLPSLIIDFYFSELLEAWSEVLLVPVYLGYAAWRVYGLHLVATVVRVGYTFVCSLLVVTGIVSALIPHSLRQQQLAESQSDIIGGWALLGLIEGMLLLMLSGLLLVGGLLRPELVLRPERATRWRVLAYFGGALVLSVGLVIGVVTVALPRRGEEAGRRVVAAAAEGNSSDEVAVDAGAPSEDPAPVAREVGACEP
jgi:hypothetical protein